MADEGARALKLHLGCGSTIVPGWENIDRSPGVLLSRVPSLSSLLGRVGVLTTEQARTRFPRSVIRADVRRRIPFPDRSAHYAYSSHMLEHMVRRDALRVVRECARVLGSGGILRIATPDLAVFVEAYQTGYSWQSMTPADSFMHLFGYASLPDSWLRRLIFQVAAQPHQWFYDGESLSRLFEEGGFEAIRVLAYRESAIPDIEEIEHRKASLFVEGVRP